MEERNWNQVWEQNYSPVVIGKNCLVRAPFHPPVKGYTYEIIIEPKMAFGTGHHPTTAMIAEYLLKTDITGLFVFDMGCGSGILGILAYKRGAAKVEMADNDPDAVNNAIENINCNNSLPVKVFLGGIEVIAGKEPDIITANISRPVLLNQMGSYFAALKAGGRLVISGIIRDDTSMLHEKAKKEGFALTCTTHREEWVMCVFEKPAFKQS
jgi:ribosomal protein L11 methyltransferase